MLHHLCENKPLVLYNLYCKSIRYFNLVSIIPHANKSKVNSYISVVKANMYRCLSSQLHTTMAFNTHNTHLKVILLLNTDRIRNKQNSKVQERRIDNEGSSSPLLPSHHDGGCLHLRGCTGGSSGRRSFG